MIIQIIGNAGEPLGDHRIVMLAPSTPEMVLIADAEGRVLVNQLYTGEKFRLSVLTPDGIPLGETNELTTPEFPDRRQITVRYPSGESRFLTR